MSLLQGVVVVADYNTGDGYMKLNGSPRREIRHKLSSHGNTVAT
tara:strand:- start:390210 stop:390341 length:132 start_codon:yes stop_codon:yes gene_type:complete